MLKPKPKLTDVNSVERVADERPSAHVVVPVVDLQSLHAAAEAARRAGLGRRRADVLKSSEKQFAAERHATEQALCVHTAAFSINLFCSSAVLDPRVGHTMDVLSPFIPVLCHSD